MEKGLEDSKSGHWETGWETEMPAAVQVRNLTAGLRAGGTGEKGERTDLR